MNGFSQVSDTVKIKQKIEFEKYHSGKTKKLKQGHFLEVVLSNKDTSHVQSGELIGLNDSFLIIDLSYEELNLDKENYTFRESFHYETPTKIFIPIHSIERLSYESKGSMVFAAIGSISMLTALFIAPIASIDKSEPNNFNSKRYTNLIKPALIGTAIGLTVYYTFGTDTMIKIKLPRKSKS